LPRCQNKESGEGCAFVILGPSGPVERLSVEIVPCNHFAAFLNLVLAWSSKSRSRTFVTESFERSQALLMALRKNSPSAM
jgi:hypothetical protein